MCRAQSRRCPIATELGVAYISILPETSRIAPGIRNALNGAERGAGQTGRRMGHTMSTALGTALGIGVAKAAGAASSVIQEALSAGYNRITTLEKADIQFRNMGYSAVQTKQQLADLNSIVTGTSTSLSDAAGAAAMLGGAGVKAGDDMNAAIKALVNISAASGASAQDIGLVMMQIKASGKLLGSEALQLAQRGVPIYDMIAKSMGKTTAEVRKLGEEGKISFDQVVTAINAGTGSLAKEMGETLPAKIANFRTSMARLSAAGMEPFLLRAKGGVVGLTGAVDTATPKLKEFAIAADAKIFDEWIPKVKGAMEALRETGMLEQAQNAFLGLWDALVDLGPAARTIAMSIAEASASLGVGGWQIFLTTLQAASTVLQGLEPILSGVGGLMQSHQSVVTGLLAAWLAFKTVPAILGRLGGAITPITTRTVGATTAMRGFSQQMALQQRLAAMNGIQIGRMGAAIGVLGTRMPIIGQMQGSFIRASGSVNHFGRTAGVAAAAGTGLRAAGSAVAGVFGGPLGMALAGVAAGATVVAAEMSEAKNQMKSLDAATNDYALSQRAFQAELIKNRGDLGADSSVTSGTAQLESYRKQIDATAESHQSAFEQFASLKWGDHTKEYWAAEEAIQTRDALDKLGYSSEELHRKMSGSVSGYMQVRQQLLAMGENGAIAAREMGNYRAKVLAQQETARRVSPGMIELGDAIAAMGDRGASSGDKLSKLKAAMDALNPARSKTEAMAQYADTIRQISTAGIDPSAFNGGALNEMSEAGGNLARTLADLADKSGQVASTGGNMGAVAAENEKVFQALADATDKPIEKIRELYAEQGGRTVDLTVSLAGQDEAVRGMGKVYAAFQAQPDKKTIELEATDVNGDARRRLDEWGIKVKEIPGTSRVSVEALTDDAKTRLDAFIGTLSAIPPGKAVNISAPGGSSVLAMLQAMGANVRTDNNKNIEVLAPLAPNVLQQLQILGLEVQRNNNKNILVRADDKDYVTKLPKWTQTEYKKIIVEAAGYGIAPNAPGMPGVAGPVPAGANGFIRRYANGGISALEKYANGGYLTEPQILPGRGVGSLYMTAAGPAIGAEGETGGEAWIPLTPGKRRRSTSLLATVADIFGFDLLPRDGMPNSVSGLLGAVAGGLATRALRTVAGVRQFADGAVLRRLADGEGASRPLTGAPYVWGGVNWGDCSGAMSAFARSAAGLDPFGGRFTTATMGGQIQQMGGQLGRGGSGDLRFGWYNGGEGGGHTAGTLPDGTNIEMGGGNGGGMVGGSVGADAPQFTDHAFFRIAPGYGDGAGLGEWQSTQGSQYYFGSGGYGSGSTSGSGDDKTLSGRLGNAASAFVSGQVQDLFNVLSINDQPGWLAAITEYENQQRSGAQGGRSVSPEERERAKAEYDAAKDSLKSDYDAAKLSRKQDYDAKRQDLENEMTLKRIDRATYERKLNELTHAYEQDELTKQQEYDSRVAEAKSRYDSATGKTPKPGEAGSDPSAALGLEQRYEDEKLARKQQHDAEKAARKERYEADKKALAEEKKNGLGEEQAKVRADRLKAQYDSDIAGMKARHESAELAKHQEFERASAAPNLGGGGGVTDPGTVKPRPGEDLGGAGAPGVPATGNAIKDAFRSGLREAWRQGPPWEATDWIINKESTWNPNARNGKYFGLGQFSPEVWAAAGIEPTADARAQGQVFDDYVGSPRYGDPMKAKAHHEANNWYDQGGIAHGIGVMQKNVLKPERVLSPSQTEAFERGMRNGFGGDAGDLGAKIDRMIDLLQVMAQQRPNVNYNVADDAGVRRAQRTERQRIATALAGN